MKITATRREDILKEKEEYESQRNVSLMHEAAQDRQFRDAQMAITDPVERYITAQLKDFGLVDVEVTVDPWGRFGASDYMTVRLRVNQRDRFHDDRTALSWDQEIWIDKDGKTQRESGSWSGLQACTDAQLDDLENTLKALRWLNSVDWNALLGKEMPRYREYLTELVPPDRTSEFNDMLAEADIAEAIGTNKAVKGTDPDDYRRKYWYKIISETPKRYKVASFSQWDLDHYGDRLDQITYEFGISKDKFLNQVLIYPLEWIEL